jgi:hypothetical protein
MNTAQSWFFESPTMNAVGHHEDKMVGHYHPSYATDAWSAFANIANVKPPVLGKVADSWKGYTGGYMYFKGAVNTFGSWKTMYQGCGWTGTCNVGNTHVFRSGGQRYHTGEYIHISCNGYKYNVANSITSRPDVSSSTPRVM